MVDKYLNLKDNLFAYFYNLWWSNSFMLLACHKKSYLTCDEITNFQKIMYIIYIYFQPAVSALLAVSVLYVEKNSK